MIQQLRRGRNHFNIDYYCAGDNGLRAYHCADLCFNGSDSRSGVFGDIRRLSFKQIFDR